MCSLISVAYLCLCACYMTEGCLSVYCSNNMKPILFAVESAGINELQVDRLNSSM